MENPTKMDDLGVPLFRNPPYIYIYLYGIYPKIRLISGFFLRGKSGNHSRVDDLSLCRPVMFGGL